MANVPWPNEDLAVLREVYPRGGWKAVARRVNKSKAAITQAAKRYGVRKIRKDGKPYCSKWEIGRDEQKGRPYQHPWPPLDAATLALQDFAYITHKGQLRPMVRVELEEVGYERAA
jgi:hypothetical protein